MQASVSLSHLDLVLTVADGAAFETPELPTNSPSVVCPADHRARGTSEFACAPNLLDDQSEIMPSETPRAR